MPPRAVRAAELRSAAVRGGFLVLTVAAFGVSIALVVLDWVDVIPAGSANIAALVMGAWLLATIMRAHRRRSGHPG